MSATGPSYYREATNSPAPGKSAGGNPRQLTRKYLIGFVYSDTRGRLLIEQSPNGSTWHVTDETSVAAGTAERLVGEMALEWGQVRFENGAGTPNTFRLYSCAKDER